MNVDIFIVSVAKHFGHLKYALRSIDKFASGFHAVHLLIPDTDVDRLYQETEFAKLKHPNWFLEIFQEWPDKGMLHHMFLEMEAPKHCPHTDAILHFDSDWVFNQPVTPESFFQDGKPICVYASFDWLCSTQQANLRMWQEAVERALGISASREFMRLPQLIHIPQVYEVAENLIVVHNGKSMAGYIREQRNEFPQGFCEYNTIGLAAWEFLHDKYHWINQETEGLPPFKIHQSWSHGALTEANMTLYKELGLM